MALYSLKKISNEASSRRTYLRGVECYNAGKVHAVHRESGEYYPEYLTAEVENDGRDGEYHVEIGFDAQGEADYYECGCPDSRETEGACKHVVALMVHKYYTDMVAGMTTAGKLLEESRLAAARTDEAARRMIDRYVSREAVQMVAATTGAEEKVSLTPILQWGYRQAELTFTLGGGRSYVLKDIAKFCADMKNNETVEYGKQLRFLHHPDCFDETSRPLLSFLLGRYEEILAGRGSAYPAVPPRVGRELPLSPSALDRFFALYAGREVAFRDGQKTGALRLAEGNPPLTAEIGRSTVKQGFTVRCDGAFSLPGARRLYVHCGDTLYRCDRECSDALREFLAAEQAGGGSLFVADKDMAEFCTGVLPAIRPYVELGEGAGQLEAFMPQHLEVECYLDAPENGVITARVLCCYGESKRDLYQPEPEDGIVRDRLGELKARLVIQRYFTGYVPGEGHLILRGDDEAVYRFITDGVADIGEVAAVYATAAFSRIGVQPPPSVAVGVRLDSELLDIDFAVDGMDMEELLRVLDSYRQNRRYHRLRSGRFIQLDGTALEGLAQIADGLGLTDKELQTGRIRVPKFRAMYLDKVLRDSESMQFKRDAAFRNLVRNMKSVADSEYAVPESLEPVLRNYQKTGYRWLKTMEQYGFCGILADDMGLGKTLQVISLLLDAREQGNDRPSLVVCPASLVLNWESEIRRFAPQLTVLPILGDAEQRAQAIRRTAGYDVAITSYDLLKRDIEQYENRLFRYHILDEAQYIKNHNTQNAKAVKAVQSLQRFALTGTPIENRLSELWSIFDFLMPGFLYTYSRFKERFEVPIVKNADKSSLDRLSRMTAPFILRRLKRDVLRELPEKTETVLASTMEDTQKALYDANLVQARRKLKEEIGARGLEGSKLTILSLLTRLRQICCDPSLCYEDYQGGSAKLESCMELLEEAAAGGHKVLLFSQFTSMLDILRKRITEAGLSYYLLEGATSKEKRALMVENFNRDDTQVFLISLKAGGTGLNLTGADVVIHYDPWWNVSAQNQATDRAHRIGQKNSVQVYKLIARDTVEEKILRLQEQKRELADAVIREGDGLIAALTEEQWMEILGQ